jgi:hypothetical protein
MRKIHEIERKLRCKLAIFSDVITREDDGNGHDQSTLCIYENVIIKHIILYHQCTLMKACKCFLRIIQYAIASKSNMFIQRFCAVSSSYARLSERDNYSSLEVRWRCT